MPFNGIGSAYLRVVIRFLNPPTIRYASRYSAIRKGFLAERGLASLEPSDNRSSYPRQHARPCKIGSSSVRAERDIFRLEGDDPQSVNPVGVSPKSRKRRPNFSAQPSYGSTKDTKALKSKAERNIEHVKLETYSKRTTRQGNRTPAAPHSLPFTTAASEFLYGHSAVIAALSVNRRKLYKLYLHSRANKESGSKETIEQLCRQSDVPIIYVDNSWLQAMDKATDGRPHNGLVLETSPLPKPAIAHLGPTSESSIALQHSPQTREDLAINGAPSFLPFTLKWRKPVILFIDDVLNPGNLGAIIRSAYFLGIDALAISMRTCSPITPAALKASAGAAEAIQILAVNAATEFLDRSVKNGWKICAAVTPDTESPRKSNIVKERPAVRVRLASKRTRLHDDESDSSVGNHPLILAVGGEEVGLRENIKKRAHYFVDIKPGIDVSEVGVDSLNVSTATALVCSHILEMSNKLSHSKRNIKRNTDV